MLVLSVTLAERLYLGHLLHIPTPSNLERTWWADLKTGRYLEHCHVQGKYSSALLEECLDVPRGKHGTVWLIGDSHARNYLPTLREAFNEHSTAYLTMGGGCTFLPEGMSSAFTYRDVDCPEYVAETSEYLLRNVRSGDVVAIGQRLNDQPERQTSTYVDFINAFALRLQAKGVPTILLDGTFPPELHPEECTALPWQPFGNREGCSVDTETVAKAFAKFDELASDAAAETESLYYAPLRTGLCNAGVCGQTMATGTPIWHDRGHITEQAAAELAPLLRAHLSQQGFYGKYSGELESRANPPEPRH
jgi:hypothetical protein